MKTRLIAIALAAALIAVAAVPMPALAAEEVALVVQLRGKALVERDGQDTFEAIIKSPIERLDIIETLRKSRAKMLFKDESVMTLGPKSRASVETFIRDTEGTGTTVFNLMSGQMRTVVGKTKFEVHTPTVVAAARGTVIEFTVAMRGNKSVTVVTCLEGTVEIRSTDPAAQGSLMLQAGKTITVMEGQNPANMEPMDTDQYDGLPRGATVVTSITTDAIDSIHTPSVVIAPPADLEPNANTTPVIVDVIFPNVDY